MRQDRTRLQRSAASPTIDDVALKADVSTATVSRCLNTPDRVSEATRRRVLDVVRQLGYAPNFGAKAMAAKRTNTIGAIIPTMDNAIFARGLQALQEELGKNGFTLLVASSSYRPDLEEEQIRTLLARGADALFLIGFDRTDEVYDYLKQRAVPAVVAWSYRQHHTFPSVGFDNRLAMKELADEVFARGHRQIGVITAPTQNNDRARERVAAVLESSGENRITGDSVRIIETHYSIDNGTSAFLSLMDGPDKPTAVICGNDVLAVGALKGARTLGMSVPGDVSITGFDDIELAQVAEPALTTVHVPHRKMGRLAADLLIASMDDPAAVSSRCLETNVVLRESLGPAPRSGVTR